MHVLPSDSLPRAPRARLATRRRWSIAAIELVIGVAAVFGGYGLLSDPEGPRQAGLAGRDHLP